MATPYPIINPSAQTPLNAFAGITNICRAMNNYQGVKFTTRAITAVFIAIGENEVAQDFKIACDVGDENEKKAVLSRLDHMHGQLVKEEGERLKRKFDQSSGIPSNDNDSTIMEEMYRANSIHNVAGVLKFG